MASKVEAEVSSVAPTFSTSQEHSPLTSWQESATAKGEQKIVSVRRDKEEEDWQKEQKQWKCMKTREQTKWKRSRRTIKTRKDVSVHEPRELQKAREKLARELSVFSKGNHKREEENST